MLIFVQLAIAFFLTDWHFKMTFLKIKLGFDECKRQKSMYIYLILVIHSVEFKIPRKQMSKQ